jgi:hypothetical protein
VRSTGRTPRLSAERLELHSRTRLPRRECKALQGSRRGRESAATSTSAPTGPKLRRGTLSPTPRPNEDRHVPLPAEASKSSEEEEARDVKVRTLMVSITVIMIILIGSSHSHE